MKSVFTHMSSWTRTDVNDVGQDVGLGVQCKEKWAITHDSHETFEEFFLHNHHITIIKQINGPCI